MFDIIVIGGGPSGMSAALYALRANKKVLILEKENFGGQIASSPLVENYPGYEKVSGLELTDKMFDQISSLGADFELEEVTNIVKENNIFKVTTTYNTYQSKVVILANGAKYRGLNLSNENNLIGKGISFCAVCDGAMYKGKDIYLIGGANSALQYALALITYAKKVYLFTLLSDFMGEEKLIKAVRNNPNIVVFHDMNLIEYLGDKKLEGLVFENTKTKEVSTFKTNNVFLAIGQLPNNSNFSNVVELNDRGYIITNENMETKTPGLYAVGDTRNKRFRQVSTACNDGIIAFLDSEKYL